MRLSPTPLLALACIPVPAASQQFGPEQVVLDCPDPTCPDTLVFPMDVHAADLDGDGDLDALTASETDGKLAWHANADGMGSFGAQQVITAAAPFAWTVRGADLDGDGDRDVLSATAIDDRVAWYANLDGLGSFGPAQTVTTATNIPTSAVAEDLDGDGDLDVLCAWASFNDAGVGWLENTDGAGSWGPLQALASGLEWGEAALAADLDGDGDPEVVASLGLLKEIVWYENTDGQGSFGPEQLAVSSSAHAGAAVATDLDGDGDADLVAKAELGNFLSWYENTDGAGTFGARHDFAPTTHGGGLVRTGDLDLDGDEDVLNAAAGDLVWFENADGAGTFGPVLPITPPAGPFAGGPSFQAIDAADLDGDGDLDALAVALSASVAFDSGRLSWFANCGCTPGVAASEVVRLGTPPNPAALLPGVTSGPVLCATWDPAIDHSGFLPGAVLDFLAVTTVPTNLPLPPFGTLLCDVSAPGTLMFDGPPGAPFALALPPNCALGGVALCVQGASFDGVQLLLTNALDVVLGSP